MRVSVCLTLRVAIASSAASVVEDLELRHQDGADWGCLNRVERTAKTAGEIERNLMKSADAEADIANCFRTEALF